MQYRHTLRAPCRLSSSAQLMELILCALLLPGRVNKCGIISPRFDMDASSSEKWVANLLPSRQFGYLVLTTSYGIMDHEEARRKQTGGKVLGFFY